MGLFILLMAAIVIIQKKIDAGYDVKRKLVKEAMEQEKAKAKAEADAKAKAEAADPEGTVWAQIRELIAGQDGVNALVAKVLNGNEKSDVNEDDLKTLFDNLAGPAAAEEGAEEPAEAGKVEVLEIEPSTKAE